MTHKTLIQKLEEIDDELVYLEDITKGDVVDSVTDVRDMIMDLVNELMDEEEYE